MEAKQSSRKRKHPPNPISGAVTRSKSLIYSHLNRSGRFRRDASSLTSHHHHRPRQPDGRSRDEETGVFSSPRRKLKSSNSTGGDEKEEVKFSQICIKDLRSRRVFSKPFVVGEQEQRKPVLNGGLERLDCEVNPNLKFSDVDCARDKSCSNSGGHSGSGELSWSRSAVECKTADLGVNCLGKVEIENPDSSRPEDSEEKDVESRACGEGREILGFQKIEDFTRNEQGLDDFSPTLSNDKRDNCLSNVKPLNDLDCDHICNEEDVQCTPPDLEIFAKQKDSQTVSKACRNVLQAKDDRMPSSISPRITHDVENASQSPSRKNDSASRRKLVLNPCARLKVFKAPSSISYRRLLPYLMDIAKEESCALEVKPCPKIEIVLEEKPSQPSQVPLTQNILLGMSDSEDKTITPKLHTAEKMTEDCTEVEMLPSEMRQGDSTNQITANPTSVNSSCEQVWPSVVIPDSRIGIPSPSNSPQGDSSCIDQGSSAKSGETNMALDSINPTLGLDQTASAIDTTLKVLQCYSDGDCKTNSTNTKTYKDLITVHQSNSPLKVVLSPEISVVGLEKGILKRNPRGCRGLCTCLNCTSFRLHAERAFEFSRNQMQDTEELVQDLMKEISQLRNVLEKSVDTNDQVRILVNQVKDACAKASKAEQIARIRLNEMNEDLFVHCRIKRLQRPRVNFAINNTEENISNMRSLSSKEA